MTLGEVEQLLDTTDHNGFPVIVSMESQYLVGFVLRRDLVLAIKAARSRLRNREASSGAASSSSSSLSLPPRFALAGRLEGSINLHRLCHPINIAPVHHPCGF